MTKEEAKNLARLKLSDERFYHTECVAQAACKLAQMYGGDSERAMTAAYLHDILKETPLDDLLKIIKSSDIISYKAVEDSTSLWHAYAGGIWVKTELLLDDEIADAVMYHTSGRANMTLLGKIVFLADYISEDRDFRGTDEVRAIAKSSINDACKTALRNQLIHLIKQGRTIDLNSVAAFNYFLKLEVLKENGK
ncbi:MAG: bis(5'-nucleosyl)-tetraphosphatase (symmetrical) YqeK [Oscillospiraceae bacterium]